jgi:hypothetical protein
MRAISEVVAEAPAVHDKASRTFTIKAKALLEALIRAISGFRDRLVPAGSPACRDSIGVPTVYVRNPAKPYAVARIRAGTNCHIRRIPGHVLADYVWRERATRKMFSGSISVTGINAVTVVP